VKPEPMIYYNTAKNYLKTLTDKKSTEEATETLQEQLDETARQIVEESRELADHANRRTIQQKDVEKAIDNLEL
jgi:histone H3/H4